MSVKTASSSIPSWRERNTTITTTGKGVTITTAGADREPVSPAPRIRVGYLRGADVIESSSPSFKAPGPSPSGTSPQTPRGSKPNVKMNPIYDSSHSASHPRLLSKRSTTDSLVDLTGDLRHFSTGSMNSIATSSSSSHKDNLIHEMDHQLCTLTELLSELVLLPAGPPSPSRQQFLSCQQCQQRQHQQHQLKPQQQLQESPVVDPSIFHSTGFLFLYDQDPRACISNLREERRRITEKKTTLELEWMRQSLADTNARTEERRILFFQNFSDTWTNTTEGLMPQWSKRMKVLDELRTKMDQIQYLIHTILVQGTTDGGALTDTTAHTTTTDTEYLLSSDKQGEQVNQGGQVVHRDPTATKNPSDEQMGSITVVSNYHESEESKDWGTTRNDSNGGGIRTVKWRKSLEEIAEEEEGEDGDNEKEQSYLQRDNSKVSRGTNGSTSRISSSSTNADSSQMHSKGCVVEDQDKPEIVVVVVDMITFLRHGSPELYDPNPDRCLAMLRSEHARLKEKCDALDLEFERQRTLIMQQGHQLFLLQQQQRPPSSSQIHL